MGFWTSLQSALDEELKAKMVAASWPNLTDGEVLLGDVHLFEQSAPPRVVIVPSSSDMRPFWASGTQFISKMQALRGARVERVQFEIHCWGGNYDNTRALYCAVIAAMKIVAPNHGVESAGRWVNSGPVNDLGKVYVQDFWIDTVVPDEMLPFDSDPTFDRDLHYAPNDVTSEGGIIYEDSEGNKSPEEQI